MFRDLSTFSGVTVLLAVVTLLAAYLRRATVIDPVIALRNE